MRGQFTKIIIEFKIQIYFEGEGMKIKKISTRKKILDSAIFLFGTERYDNVSVAKICRNAGVSNGIIYKYFKNKEEIYRDVLDMTVHELSKNTTLIEGVTPSSKLLSYIELIFQSTMEMEYLLAAYKEGEYKFEEYDKRLRGDIYLKALSRIYGREIEEVEYLYITSGIRYVSMKNTRLATPLPTRCLRNFIAGGIGDNPQLTRGLIPVEPLKEEAEEGREEILEKGMRLFGEKGFQNIKISDIAKASEISVGSFYLNFETKENFFEKIMLKIQGDMLTYLSSEEFLEETRVERVVKILEKFISFFQGKPYKYRFMREAEFMLPKGVESFYSSLEEFLYSALEMERTEKNNVIVNCILGIAHYSQIELYFTENLKDRGKLLNELRVYLQDGISE